MPPLPGAGTPLDMPARPMVSTGIPESPDAIALPTPALCPATGPPAMPPTMLPTGIAPPKQPPPTVPGPVCRSGPLEMAVPRIEDGNEGCATPRAIVEGGRDGIVVVDMPIVDEGTVAWKDATPDAIPTVPR